MTQFQLTISVFYANSNSILLVWIEGSKVRQSETKDELIETNRVVMLV